MCVYVHVHFEYLHVLPVFAHVHYVIKTKTSTVISQEGALTIKLKRQVEGLFLFVLCRQEIRMFFQVNKEEDYVPCGRQ